MSPENSTTTKLLTLLNVTATRVDKRKFAEIETPVVERVKLNKKKRAAVPSTTKDQPRADDQQETNASNYEIIAHDEDEDAEPEESLPEDTPLAEHAISSAHFGNTPSLLTPRTIAATPSEGFSKVLWSKVAHTRVMGKSTEFKLADKDGVIPESAILSTPNWRTEILKKLLVPLDERANKLSPDLREFQATLLSALLSYKDILHARMLSEDIQKQTVMRSAMSLHIINHIMKIRQIVLRNNDRISSFNSAEPRGSVPPPSPESIQDQGFTRPSTLLLVPFRNSALRWMDSFLSNLPSKSNKELQIHNHARFLSEFSLPPGSVDKLAESVEAAKYPADHIENFKGNIDDNFRVGVKITRKSVRLFEGFYGSDLIIASPLGLRLAIEKEKSSDFLSSIEVVVMDQTDVLTMQNWEHVKFIFSCLNLQPKESHDTDFSRIKNWYLDGHAPKLRQTVLLSAYETPQIRAFFTNSLCNIAGKVRFENRWEGVKVPEGIKQEYLKFECNNALLEPDKRFDYFTKEVFPAVLKSAVQSANTVIFIPSYFDFIRVKNWIRKRDDLSVTWLSEDSSTKDISRAREAFFSGSRSFLIVTERFHFFRRYRIRGVLNLIFYGPPDHASFYSEFLSFPFIDEGVEPADITCKVLYSKYDAMALERILGTKAVGSLLKS